MFVGLCHSCNVCNIKTELDEFSKPCCISCREELAATRRKKANEK